jgi:outer membrane protein OmpA-like peptidoglycan-associated protein
VASIKQLAIASVFLAVASVATALFAPPAVAQPTSKDCMAAARRIGDAVILPAWCTVELENDDRKARLRRLSKHQGRSPQFFEYVVPEASLRANLPDFPTDVPVLRVVFEDNVLFDFDRAEVRAEAEDIIDLIAASLKREPPDVAVFIAGHTDAKGDDAYNIALSSRRADAVAHALLDRGIGMSAVFRVAFGEAMPIASNDNDTGRAQNRRVEFLFAAKPAAAAVWLAEQASATCYGGDAKVLDNCRRAITVAEEVRIDTPALAAPAVSAKLDSPRNAIAVGASSARADLGQAKGVNLGVRPLRRFSIDLGRKAVSIGTPTR